LAPWPKEPSIIPSPPHIPHLPVFAQYHLPLLAFSEGQLLLFDEEEEYEEDEDEDE
jgi:hypothetical protein